MQSEEEMNNAEVKEGIIIDTKTKGSDSNKPMPDPFWPQGAVPLHLTKAQQNDSTIVKAFEGVKGNDWKCSKCGKTTDRYTGPDAEERDNRLGNMCRTCAAVHKQESALGVKTNDGWMDRAKELGLEIFERQPDETDSEWRIWQTYRNYYPMKLPTYSELASRLGIAPSIVVRAVTRWSYKVRLIEWSRFTDATIQEKRITAIKTMNENQLIMAQNIQTKLKDAIAGLNPATLKPSDIVSLFKVATDLERKVTEYVTENVKQPNIIAEASQSILTKSEDLGDIIGILQSAGVIKKDSVVGVEQATRIIVKGADSNGDNDKD